MSFRSAMVCGQSARQALCLVRAFDRLSPVPHAARLPIIKRGTPGASVIGRRPLPRLVATKDANAAAPTAAEDNGDGAAARAPAAEVEEEEEEEEEEQAENNPELHPLKEALQRAQRRREEATGIREALEAEAQEVAQLAVNAQGAVNKVKKQLEEGRTELAAAQSAQAKLEEAIAAVQAQVQERAARDAAAKEEAAAATGAAEAEAEAEAGADAASDAAPVAAPPPPPDVPVLATSALEDEAWERSQELEAAMGQCSELAARIAALETKLSYAQEGYEAADRIAAAAMEAAESAVRDEMECIAVVKETEEALKKAIEDLRALDDTSEMQETSFERKTADEAASKAATAAAAAAAAAPVTVDLAGAAAAATPPPLLSMDEEQAAAVLAGTPRAVASAAAAERRRSLYVGAGVAALLAVAALALHQTGALASLAAKAAAAAGSAGRLWDVVLSLLKRVPLPHVHESEAGLLETIWLLLASVITVPLVCKLPGGSPVLGFLAGGALVGPYALGIIRDVESIRHLAELGVVFLLFNIGLELSFDRLARMGKFVFGMGTAQVVLTLAAVAYTGVALTGGVLGGPAAIILGGGLALSTTAVGMQVLADRGETGSKFGRATFSVLLLQDLAVVVLLMLIPLLAPGSASEGGGMGKIAAAIGLAGVKAVVTMAAITLAGRTLLRPLYRRVAETKNAELFAALTLLVVLGTSMVTQLAGLSLALGAFLAGLLLAETEYHLQVESDIAPYKGLLMGLFFMTVGMEISVGLLLARFRTVLAAMALLIAGKVAVMGAVGQAFGLTPVQSLRAGLLLAPGGEFAFVLFGEAVAKGIMQAPVVKELYLVVALSMALTPFLAQFGGRLAKLLERSDMKALQPKEGETSGLSGHVIICGFGRVGQLIAQMLAEHLIPFVALDTSASRVQEGKEQDLPVYFGDAGSPAVLHAVGAHRAACAVITLDTAGANYRSVYAMHKHFPGVKTFVRAFDIASGLELEKAGATAVIPEVLEPSLQLAAAVLSQMDMPEAEVADTIREFRRNHLSELQQLAAMSGSSLGYGSSLPLPPPPASDGGEGAGEAAPAASAEAAA